MEGRNKDIVMRGKVVDAYNKSSKEDCYMIMIQEGKGKRYNKGLKLNDIKFFTTDKEYANEICRKFNNNSL